jgi:hypothetical protein
MNYRQIIELTDEEIQQCRDYAKNAWVYYERQDRTDEQIELDVFESKLSELAAEKMMKPWNEINEPVNFEITKHPDPGYDLICRNMKINVKMCHESELNKKWRVYIKYEYDFKGGAYWYMLMMLTSNYNQIKYIGKVRLKELTKKNIPTDEKGNQYLLMSLFENSKS